MGKKKNDITILAIGDRADYDSYKKFHKEKEFILEDGFRYKTVRYSSILKGRIPDILTDRVIVFFFFPFVYWNRHIEHRHYRGVYGNRMFHTKFKRFCGTVIKNIKGCLPDKEILFINDPLLSSLYRDKLYALKVLSKNGVSVPRLFNTTSIREIKRLMENGHRLFIKPRCGSMGKGITFLQLGDWQTNFEVKNDKIISRRSDHGWRFRDITDNTRFLRDLLRKNVFMEKAIEPLSIKGDRVDLRVYAFFDKVLYVYPRRNKSDEVTTNISQGGRGDPGLLKVIPDKVLAKVERTVLKTVKALNVNFAGVDVIIDNTLKNVYVVDVNMFPGFPKRKTFNLAQELIHNLKRLDRSKKLRFQKGGDIQV